MLRVIFQFSHFQNNAENLANIGKGIKEIAQEAENMLKFETFKRFSILKVIQEKHEMFSM